MNNQEAIEFLNSYINEDVYNQRCVVSHNMAIEALEKQIPKKVIKKKCETCEDDCNTECKGYADWCPSCNGCLSNDYNKEYIFCPECGQAIDWSDDNEKGNKEEY